MIIPDPRITLGDLWLIVVGYILGLYTTLIVWALTHMVQPEAEELQVEEPVLSRPCAWCWYEKHPYGIGFPAQASSRICERHAAEQRRLRQAAKALRVQQSARREEAIYAK